MTTYENESDFLKNAPEELKDIEMTFTEIQKGTMIYTGEYKGLIVVLSGSCDYISNYEYLAEEKLESIVDFDNCWLVLYDSNHKLVEELLNV